MKKRNIIVMGGSAGGYDAFQQLIGHLPPDLDAAIFIVWHMAPSVRGLLPQVLAKCTTMPVAHARDGEIIETNRIYVGPMPSMPENAIRQVAIDYTGSSAGRPTGAPFGRRCRTRHANKLLGG